MTTPCYKDTRFIGTADQMREVASKCFDCPVVQFCGEAGIGELEGVWGGMLPTEEVRRNHRKTNDRNHNCRNGHPKELYRTVVYTAGGKPVDGCSWCAKLLLEIAVA